MGEVLGRDEDKEKIIKLLISEQSSLIAIVGEGGVGKTTLARLVFDDPRVAGHFEMKRWVTAYERYYLWDLERHYFLLILDDLQDVKMESQSLNMWLKVGVKGSKVLIITASPADLAADNLVKQSYHLKGLSHGDCWCIFRECACVKNNEQLEEVGMKIVEKLEGLPLAAEMVGCLLRSNIDLNDWNMVLNADDWKSKPDELNGIPAALWLCYQHLPPHIKQCFAYCSVFPRAHKFDKESLVQMWMAHGLIQLQDGVRMEDLGSGYFDYLLNRSFFRRSGEDKYMMHDLVHSLAVSMSVGESVCLNDLHNVLSDTEKKKKVRHLSIQSDNLSYLFMFDRLHTVILDLDPRTVYSIDYDARFMKLNDYDAIFMKLKCIRVLCLSDTMLICLPKSIANLKQLRYLDLRKTPIVNVPDELCGLHNLQTLKLSESSFSAEALPYGMSNLINLRHLKASAYQVSKIHDIGKLTSLQELEEFTVQREDGHQIEELKNMSQLRGKLCISQLENVHTMEEAKEAKLNEKKHLRTLELNWSWDNFPYVSPKESKNATLEGLRPHSNLKELFIQNNGGSVIPSWLQDGSLVSLQALEILDCRHWDLLLIGKLQYLKSLIIERLPQLLQVGGSGEEDDQLFPCLRVLNTDTCLNLKDLIPLPPSLEELSLFSVGLTMLPGLYQSKSSSLSSSALASLHIYGCHQLTSLQVGLLEHQNQYRLQALRSLTIQNCHELVYLPDYGFSALPSLKSLHIENCHKLTYKPVDNGSTCSLPSSLTELKIIRCAALTNDSFFTSLQRLHSLDSLLINADRQGYADWSLLTSLPVELLQHLKALTELEIVNCEGLLMLGLQALVSLKRLKIAGCPKLAECSSSADTSASLLLEYIEIEDSSPLFLSMELLRSLRFLDELKIVKCFHLVTFPNSMEEGLHCLVSLKKLHIYECPILQSLPKELASIPSLVELYLIRCGEIQSIPEKGLPPSLLLLVINQCFHLAERCNREGEDWAKIAHVLYTEVNGPKIKAEAAEQPQNNEDLRRKGRCFF